MSTRCTINFFYNRPTSRPVAKIYRHCDGYPEGTHGVIADLARFFAAVTAQCGGDTRFSDPSYLAAKFVVWQASQNADAELPLKFISLGVCREDAMDLEYNYAVCCSNDNLCTLHFSAIPLLEPRVLYRRYGQKTWKVFKSNPRRPAGAGA